MPRATAQAPAETQPDPAYDRDAIFNPDSPIDPRNVQGAIHTIMRCVQIDPDEPPSWTSRRMFCAMRGLSALHPRDEIELMLGVQALNAYHTANAFWCLAANPQHAKGDNNRAIAKATAAARTFDTMLRALERRQAKPLSIPIGRPAAQVWRPVDTPALWQALKQDCELGEAGPLQDGIGPTDKMTDDEMICAWMRAGRHRMADENAGLDIANTEGILPNGGMIMPEDPTPQQAAYVARRLTLRYCREKEKSRRQGLDQKIVFRPLRPGDLIL
jgi:hypothetical protein